MAERFDVDSQHPVRRGSDLGPAGDAGSAHVCMPYTSGKPVTRALGSEAPRVAQTKRGPIVPGGKGGTHRAPR